MLITVDGLYGDVLNDEHCQANLIEYQVVQEADVPSYLQGNIPDGKQAVYHRVRVHNGNGKLEVAISQICLWLTECCLWGARFPEPVYIYWRASKQEPAISRTIAGSL